MLIYSFICQQILKCLCFRKWMIQRVKSNKGNYSPIKSFSLSCTLLENTEGYNCWFNCSSGYGSTNQPLRLSTLMRRILCSPDVSSKLLISLDKRIGEWHNQAQGSKTGLHVHQLFYQIHCARLIAGMLGWATSLQGIVWNRKEINFCLRPWAKVLAYWIPSHCEGIMFMPWQSEGVRRCVPADLGWWK